MSFRSAGRPWWSITVSVGLVVLLSACASPRHRAPVEERNLNSLGTPPATANGMAGAPAPNPNAGQPGYYTVKPGDTLIRVGLETGQSWRDIMAWNNMENPNVLEVGQVLRVVPPAANAAVASTSPISTARVESRPLDAKAPAAAASAVAPGPVVAAAPVVPPLVPTTPAPATAAAPAATGPAREVDDINWTWPAAGSVVASFDDARNKGLGIAGKPGDPIFAAADGKVVYAGSGLRGYGNLVIVKHNNSYLTAYAHNQALLVKEDQSVRRGQKIAEMGSTDADRVKLHFEIRKEGKPVDPARYLPPR